MNAAAALLLCSSLALLAPLAKAQEPKPATATKTETPVYDEAADARQVVAAALAKASKENQRVLIQWGANWCGWCKWLAGTMQSDRDLSRKLNYEYQVVHVDVGRFDKNLELAKELGAKFEAIPFLTILDATGKPLAQQNTEPFETKVDGKPGHDGKLLVQFLTEHESKPLDAKAVLAAGLATAAKEQKRVFLHFGAPWCGWCHKLEDWMAQPEVAAVLGKEFVDVKIDTDRMTGGKAAHAQQLAAAGQKPGGIPWFVLLDADGKQLAHSNAADGNIGFPVKPEEIAHFVTMLRSAKQHLTDDDITFLQRSLTEARERAEAAKQAR